MKLLIVVEKIEKSYSLTNNIASLIKIWSKNNEILLYSNIIGKGLIRELKGINIISGFKETNNEYIIKSYKPDVIINYCENILYVEKIIDKCNAKLYSVVHSSKFKRYTDFFADKNDNIIAIANNIKNNPTNKVIYPGINMKEFYPTKKSLVLKKKLNITNNYKTILVAKNLDRQIDTLKQLIKIIPVLSEIVGGLNLIICGDGENLTELKNFTSKIESKKFNILITGFVKNMRSYINLSDLVLASDRTAIEAILCNKKVFYMGDTKWKCLIQDNNFKDVLFYNRLWTKYTNEELVQHLNWMLTQEETLKDHTKDLMERVTDECDSEIVANKYINLFNGKEI